MPQTRSAVIPSADVGGTKTNIALYTAQRSRLQPVIQHSFVSRQARTLEEIVRRFLELTPKFRPVRACFGLAGPVLRGTCRTPNLPWVVEQEALQEALGIPHVDLINDLEATGYGIQRLKPQFLVTLNTGKSGVVGHRALIAAGTGLGEGFLWWDGWTHHPVPSEGGHADFAPRSALEADLLTSLLREHAHVSYERVVSGPGLYRIYRFLRARSKRPELSWLRIALRHRDPATVISRAALGRRDAVCRQALELFASIYGAEAGNLAMKPLARGGVYVGGGIAPKILPVLRSGVFMRAFLDKGRMRDLLAEIPVRVILEEQTALLGAAQYAWLQLFGRTRRASDRPASVW